MKSLFLMILILLLVSCVTPQIKSHHWVKIDGSEIANNQDREKLVYDYERCFKVVDRSIVGMNPDYITEARLKILVYCMEQRGWLWKEGVRPTRVMDLQKF